MNSVHSHTSYYVLCPLLVGLDLHYGPGYRKSNTQCLQPIPNPPPPPPPPNKVFSDWEGVIIYYSKLCETYQ